MANQEVLVRLTDELVARLDERAEREGRSRSALVREAIDAYLRDGSEAAIDAAIVAGYTRTPDEPDRWNELLAKESIRREPWPSAPRRPAS